MCVGNIFTYSNTNQTLSLNSQEIVAACVEYQTTVNRVENYHQSKRFLTLSPIFIGKCIFL